MFVVRVKNREKFQEYLLENEIGTQIHYPIPPHLFEAYEYLGHEKRDFLITEDYANTIISLPLYEGITEEEIAYIIDTINRYES